MSENLGGDFLTHTVYVSESQSDKALTLKTFDNSIASICQVIVHAGSESHYKERQRQVKLE